jgi:adenine C2-methylase RlmN of 23S rRNA A2503 and tRNA A37
MLSQAKILTSKLDKSVNWITPFGKGQIETRYVLKTKPNREYVIAYLSSHSGCKMACKFCYLTQQKQTSFDHVPTDTYVAQVQKVIEHSKQNTPNISHLNVNFMSRGEALANKYIITDYPDLHTKIDAIAKKANMTLKMNISTIMPHTIRQYRLKDIFGDYQAHVYYSLYSINPEFRKKWMPNALPYEQALDKLKDYEMNSKFKYPVAFHWALIKGENDSIKDAETLAKLLYKYDFKSKFNLVRYNAHPDSSSEESDEARYKEIFNIISSSLKSEGFEKSESYIVPRVGKDVYASCGMFIPNN